VSFCFVRRFVQLVSFNVAHCLIQPARSSRACRLETAAYLHTDLQYVAVNKDAFPTSPACVAGRIKSFRLPKQAQVSSVIHQAQYQAFVRFAVDSCAAFLSHRAQKDLRFGTFSPGAGSRFENSDLDPYLSTGPVTLD
jgi:hypothetical protein